jgi:hypothetical protein
MGWYQLVGLMREAKTIEERDRTTPPTSCAQCYTALRGGPEGQLYCPWDGLIWPDDASAWGEYPGSY